MGSEMCIRDSHRRAGRRPHSPSLPSFPPLDETLQHSSAEFDADQVEVQETNNGHVIEETYTILETGMITATITDVDTGWSITATKGRPTTSTGTGRA